MKRIGWLAVVVAAVVGTVAAGMFILESRAKQIEQDAAKEMVEFYDLWHTQMQAGFDAEKPALNSDKSDAEAYMKRVKDSQSLSRPHFEEAHKTQARMKAIADRFPHNEQLQNQYRRYFAK